jgi:hypothetical protein
MRYTRSFGTIGFKDITAEAPLVLMTESVILYLRRPLIVAEKEW